MAAAVVDPAGTFAPDDPALVGPLLSEEAYTEVLAFDLGRFYRPPADRDLRAAWQPMLANLDALGAAARRAGVPVAWRSSRRSCRWTPRSAMRS